MPTDTVLVSQGGYTSYIGDVDGVRLDSREFCVLSITAAGWHSGALVLPITGYVRTGAEPNKREDYEMFPAIHNDGNHAGKDEIFRSPSDSEREFDASNLRIPRTGHRGIRGISTVARGMRGGLRVRGRGMHGSGVMRSGADEMMRRRAFDEAAPEKDEKDEQQGEGGDEILGRGGIRGGRQLGGETAEAGERLGESIRMAVRGVDKREPTK